MSETMMEPTSADSYAESPEPVSRDTRAEERQLVGTVLTNPGSASADVLSLSAECFSDAHCRHIWPLVVDRAWNGLRADVPAVAEQVRDHPGAVEFVNRLAIENVSPALPMTLPTLVGIIRKGHVGRKTEQALTRAWQQLALGQVETARSVMSGVDPDEGVTDPWTTLSDGWAQALAEAEDPAAILPTPWPTVNRHLSGGLKSRELYIAAGSPGSGKTAGAQVIANQVAESGATVAVFSLEMGITDLARRMMSTAGKIDMGEVMRPGLDMTSESYGKANTALESIGHHVLIDDSEDLTIRELRNRARLAVRRHQVSLIVVDYAQLVETDNPRDDERITIATVTKELKKMARELHVPVFALAQPNRGAALQGRRLEMTDLHGSGALERYAAAVILMNKITDEDEHGNPVDTPFVNFDLDKNRYGPTGRVRMLADLSRQNFEEMAQG